MRPVGHGRDQAMLDRVEMNVINMLTVVAFIANDFNLIPLREREGFNPSHL